MLLRVIFSGSLHRPGSGGVGVFKHDDMESSLMHDDATGVPEDISHFDTMLSLLESLLEQVYTMFRASVKISAAKSPSDERRIFLLEVTPCDGSHQALHARTPLSGFS